MVKDLILGMLGVIGSFGMVQVMLSNDTKAINQYRILCFELKKLLEDFADYLTLPSRNSQNDLPRLKEIRKIIEQLYVEKEGLTFSYHLLNKLLEESLPLFDRARIKDGNKATQPYFIGSELLQIWGLEITHPCTISKMTEVQKYLYKSFSRRFFSRIRSLFKKNLI